MEKCIRSKKTLNNLIFNFEYSDFDNILPMDEKSLADNRVKSSCSGKSLLDKTNYYSDNSLNSFSYNRNNCITCTPGNCSNTGTFAGPTWTKFERQPLCNHCRNTWLPGFAAQGGCQDSTRNCFVINFIQDICDILGDPPEPSTCTYYQLIPCGGQQCEAAEVCDDYFDVDEDCSGFSNCNDEECHNTQECQAECDKDGDGYISSGCRGNDCSDDPAADPNAADINPGNTENTQERCSNDFDDDCNFVDDCTDESCQNTEVCSCLPSEICDDPEGTHDEDCDGFRNCTDSDCTQHPSCQLGGENPNHHSYQCYGYYLITTYYNCNSQGCTYMYETWEYLGQSCVLTQ